MIFTSLVFVGFAAIVLPLVHALPHRARNPVLLLASWVFYGWWDWRFLALLWLSTVVDFASGLGIGRATDVRVRRLWLATSLVVNLGVLGFFKYFGFFADSVAVAMRTLGFEAHPVFLEIVLPVGISFYTLQTLAYTIDVYRGRMTPCADPVAFALYVAFFPQLVAGPIERAQRLLPQLQAERVLTPALLRTGLALVAIGWFKKVGIADGVAPFVDEIFADPGAYSGATVALGGALFSLQVYGDFSGYSDLARGLARLLGVELMVNFRQPFLAGNVAELWRDWHVSLMTWFRDYLYVPLGGRTGNAVRDALLLLFVFGVSGLWHGAGANYVGWGLVNGLSVVGFRIWLATPLAAKGPLSWRSPRRWAGTALTLAVFALALVIFRAGSAAGSWTALAAMALNPTWLGYELVYVAPLLLYGVPILALDAWQRASGVEEPMLAWSLPARGVLLGVVALWVLVLGGVDVDVPFIYFRF